MKKEDGRKNNGGSRKGPPTKTMKSYRIDNDLIEFLKEQKNANQFVNDAIREKKNNLK